MGTEKTKTPILSDVALQEIPWRKAVREAVKNGRLPLWNRFVLAGEPLLAVQQHAFFHPATWIGFLLPLAQAWTFEMALRYFLSLLCAYLFLRDLACGEAAALLGAVGWAFCDYMVFFLGYPLTPAAAPFPLLLLGLRRLVSAGDRRAVGADGRGPPSHLTSGSPGDAAPLRRRRRDLLPLRARLRRKGAPAATRAPVAPGGSPDPGALRRAPPAAGRSTAAHRGAVRPVHDLCPFPKVVPAPGEPPARVSERNALQLRSLRLRRSDRRLRRTLVLRGIASLAARPRGSLLATAREVGLPRPGSPGHRRRCGLPGHHRRPVGATPLRHRDQRADDLPRVLRARRALGARAPAPARRESLPPLRRRRDRSGAHRRRPLLSGEGPSGRARDAAGVPARTDPAAGRSARSWRRPPFSPRPGAPAASDSWAARSSFSSLPSAASRSRTTTRPILRARSIRRCVFSTRSRRPLPIG